MPELLTHFECLNVTQLDKRHHADSESTDFVPSNPTASNHQWLEKEETTATTVTEKEEGEKDKAEQEIRTENTGV